MKDLITKNDSLASPITVFIISWGRPIYLWSCLDALYRLTRTPARFILIDNFHPDPLIQDVINGFERRGLFAEVIRFPTNSFENIRNAYYERLADIGPLHVYIESDCVICEQTECWLETMQNIMNSHQNLGLLGSLVDTKDFVSESTALSLTGGDLATAEFLAKLNSPERQFANNPDWADTSREIFITQTPCPVSNPPGRLMMLRTEQMIKIGFHLDYVLAAHLRDRGFESAICPLVRHRHLSLLNIFDYDQYEAEHRHSFFSKSHNQA